jgi:hypothetical protein
METNPTFKDFFTIFEQPQKDRNKCILSAKIIKNIIDKYRTSSPLFPTMNMEESVHNLTLLFDMYTNQSSKKNSNYWMVARYGLPDCRTFWMSTLCTKCTCSMDVLILNIIYN